MKIWAIYTQHYPDSKYDEQLESLWSTKEKALKFAKKIYWADRVFVTSVLLDDTDDGDLYDSDAEIITVKQ